MTRVGILALGFVLALAGAPARAADGDMDAACGLGALVRARVPEARVLPSDPGAVIVVEVGAGFGALWVGFTAEGVLLTSRRTDAASVDLREAVAARIRALLGLVDGEAGLRACPALRIDPRRPLPGEAAVDAAITACRLEAGNRLAPAAPLPKAPAQPLFSWRQGGIALAATSLLALGYGLLLLARARRDLRRGRWVGVATAAGLVCLALLVRGLFAPRAPMVAALGDMERLSGALSWVDGPLSWRGGYPPAFSLLLTALMRPLGASFQLAFWATTVAGALTVLPAAAIARRLAGPRAGVVAGVAFATLPLAAIFANGVNLVTPAGLFLAATFAHGLAWAEQGERVEAWATLLAGALFVQMRPEGLVQAPFLALVGVALVWRRRALSRGLLAALAVVGSLSLPFVGRTLFGGPGAHGTEVVHALRDLVVAGPTMLALLLLVRRVPPGSPGRWWACALGAAAAAGVALVVRALALDGWQAIAPAWSEWPRVGDATLSFAPSYGSARGHVIDNPWLVPLWLVPLWALSLVPPRAARSALALGGALALAGTALYIFRFSSTSIAKSGELIADGARYLVPAAPLLAAGVGVGAERLLELVSGASGRRALGLALVLLALLPLWTHRAVLADLDFDQQRQFAFLERHLPTLPAGAHLLLPDHMILDEGGVEPAGTVFTATRIGPTLDAFNRVFGLPASHGRLERWIAGEEQAPEARLFVFLGVACAQTPSGAESLACRAVRALPEARVVARETIRGRTYTRYPLVRAAHIELALVEVPGSAAARLRGALGPEASLAPAAGH